MEAQQKGSTEPLASRQPTILAQRSHQVAAVVHTSGDLHLAESQPRRRTHRSSGSGSPFRPHR
jgi:hypothetical protein